MSNLAVTFKTPTEAVFVGESSSVIFRTPLGQITILPLHEPMVGVIEIGEVKITSAGSTKTFLSGRGIFKIAKDELTILTDEAHSPSNLTIDQIEEAKRKAKLLSEQSKDARTTAYTKAQFEKSFRFLGHIKHRSRHNTNLD